VCRGPEIGSVPSVLTQATQTTVDSWLIGAPDPHQAGQHLHPGADGGPVLPHVGGQLPPASVTDPDNTDAGTPTSPTANDVQHTVHHLTDGLSNGQQDDIASTVSDTANNLLDAVGAAGNQVAGALDDTINGVTSVVPSNVLPTLP
jgi:hypothetical protein